jgi:hypothetical protein
VVVDAQPGLLQLRGIHLCSEETRRQPAIFGNRYSFLNSYASESGAVMRTMSGNI